MSSVDCFPNDHWTPLTRPLTWCFPAHVYSHVPYQSWSWRSGAFNANTWQVPPNKLQDPGSNKRGEAKPQPCEAPRHLANKLPNSPNSKQLTDFLLHTYLTLHQDGQHGESTTTCILTNLTRSKWPIKRRTRFSRRKRRPIRAFRSSCTLYQF